MLKSTVLGLGTFALLSPVSAAVMPMELAQTPPAPLVTEICGVDKSWTAGFRIGETVPLDPSQYHRAVTITKTPLRAGYGFEGPVIADLAVGAQVTVMGEVWDMGCNQWMVVPADGGVAYIHGNALQNL
ncbi:MAG: hypothetical protein ACFBSG_06795 [Leptolyngbyaceae cyanobacterium]